MGIIELCNNEICSKNPNKAEDQRTDYTNNFLLERSNKDINSLNNNPINEKEKIQSEYSFDVFPENSIDIKVKTSDLITKREGHNIKENYEIISCLGGGSFGEVYKISCKNSEDSVRALKKIPKENLKEGVKNSQVISEVEILKNLDHPNIMKIFEFYEDDKNFYLITEFCDYGDLYSLMVKIDYMPEVSVKLIMYQILGAVAYLHSKHIMHGDIKLENILLDRSNSMKKSKIQRFTRINKDFKKKESLVNEINNDFINKKLSKRTKEYIENITDYEVKLIDFGCSKLFSKNKSKKLSGIIGTSIYCSPEVIHNSYNEKSDMWSLGVLMYILLCGEPPFYADTDEKVFKEVLKGKYNINHENLRKCSNNCRDLISKLLEYDPNKRFSAEEALKHQFLKEGFDPEKALILDNDFELMKKLLNVSPLNKFQEVVLAYLALNFCDKAEEKKIRKLFRYVNIKNNNVISKEELLIAYKDNGYMATEEEIDKIFSILDSDKNGLIEYQEFLRSLCDKNKLLSKENLKVAFDFFDVEKKQTISWDDIMKIMFKGIDVPQEKINLYMEEEGVDRDKQMKFDDFVNYIIF